MNHSICPRCKGSGETTAMYGRGPDAYEGPAHCPPCRGTGELERACESCGDVQTLESFMPSIHRKDGIYPICKACTLPPDILTRIARWYDYATRNGIKLDCIAVHSSDFSAAPHEYKGLKVKAIGVRP